MRKSQIPLLAILFLYSSTLIAQVACPTANPITVNRTTGGTGVSGSLPWAINCMNNVTTLNTIQFSITGAGPHVIQPNANAPLPTITKNNAHIDGSTDNIVIDGSLGQAQGLVLAANNIKVNGLTLRNFASTSFPNGLVLSTGNGHEILTCQIFDNLVGISVARSVGSFTISNNSIGVDKSGTNLSNTNTGIEVATFAGTAAAPTGTISSNIIAYSSNGIQVGTGRNVVISRNSIFCNSKIGIERLATLIIPTISNATTTQVTGTAPAGSVVEVFRVNNTTCPNAPCQGGTFIGSVTTNAFGAWNLSVTSGLSAGNLVTATMTQSNNTSEFSTCRTVVDVCANFLASIKSNNVTCNGGTNGSATVSASGGLNQGISFSWSNGATTATINNLKAGTYTVTASDAAGCQSIQLVNVLQPTAIIITPSSVNVACNGEKSGLINAAVTGGIAPYTYRWSNGATTSAITSLVAGAYTLTVTDQNNCTKTASVTVTQPTAINLLLSGNDTLCAGAKNGTALATVSGGVTPYSYAWSTGATTSSISNLGVGNYTVTVTDQNKCQKSGTISVIETAPLRLDSSVIQPKCAGEVSGSIEIKISGGVPPFSYLWENGATTANRSNLMAGEYKVAVTDANRCSDTWVFTLKDPDPINAEVFTSEPACFGQTNGSAKAFVSSPGVYTFLWSTGATTSAISDLGAGQYNVTVTSANGCTATFPFTLNAPSSGVDLKATVTNIDCFGQSTGQIQTSTTGGKAPYVYLWSNGSTTADLSNLKAGNYAVTVSDQSGCGDTASVTLRQNPAITTTLTPANPACFGQSNGQLSVAVSGGSPAYSYLWSTGATTSAITSLAVGKFVLTVTDALRCTKKDSAQLTAPTEIQVNATATNVICTGTATGSAQAIATGGTAPYTYAWSAGANTSSISNLGVGNYTVTATDQNKCQKSGTISVLETAPLRLDSSLIQPKCAGEASGSIDIKVSGGIAPYTYLWENGATTANRSNLIAGTYKVTVTDANRCSSNWTFTLKDPTPISAQVNTTEPACFGQTNGTANVTVSSPGNHTFLWSTGATTSAISNIGAGRYNLTVTNANGCKATFPFILNAPSAGIDITTQSSNIDCFGQSTGQIQTNTTGGRAPYLYIWSTGATTANLSKLPAGTYAVTVTDQSGCGDTANVIIRQNPAITTNITTSNPACFGQSNGQLSVTVSGGSPAYSYLWSTGATTSAINNLVAGKFVLTITDALRCTKKDSAQLTAPSQLQATVTATNVNCNGTATGSAQAIATGGTSPYSYAWSTGATTSAISNLAANTYGVTISDSRACQLTRSATVTQPAALALLLTTFDIPCNESNTGRATAQASGGTSPYRYTWSNGATTSALSNLASGDYAVTVTDAAGCVVNDTKRVNSAAGINPQISATNILCNGQSNGQASVTVTGNGVHFYLWSNGATTSAINNLAAGTYSVTVTNSANCKESASTTITVPPVLTLNVVPTNLRCNGQNQGQALATAGGGVAPYTYRWSNGATTSSITTLAAGNYSLTLTDANQCTRTQNVSITEPSALQANATFTRETSPNARNGTATATATGGTSPYRFNWSTGATTAAITGLAPGVYTVTVQDANGCSLVRSGSVSGDNCPGLNVSGIATDLSCAGAETGSISLKVLGGTTPYFYAWSNGQTTANLSDLNEGTYSVTVSDANGCTGNYSTTLKAGSKMPKPLYGIVAPDTVCGNETFTLRADDLFQGPNVIYVWQLPNGEELTSMTPSLKLKATSSAYSGEYAALRDSAGCRSSVFGPVIVDVVSLPPNSFSAGRDTTLCQGTSITLKAQAPASGKATWFALSTRTSIQNANSPNATAQNLQIGANRFVWRIAIGKCIQAASDTVSVFLEKKPQLADDKYTIERAQDIAAMNILLNDNLAGIQDTTISWSGAPTMGTFEYVPGNKSFRYTAEAEFRGVLTFTYTVCNEASKCASPCDSALVAIEVFNLPKPTEGMVLEDPGPNGTLQIRGLQGFSSVDIVITNRWGDIVYRNNSYDNNAPWRGRSGDNGPFLPPGAYYYVIRAYDDGKLVGKPQTGAIYLFKKENP